jgi:uncharacterized protein HemX
MKNKDRTIKEAIFAKLDKKISFAHYDLQDAAHTVSIYFGRTDPLTQAWRSALAEIIRLRAATRRSFQKKILN